MITLREIIKLNEMVTLLDLYVRKPDGKLIRQAIIGQPYKMSVFQERDRELGKLERIDVSINRHGRPNKAGMSEMTYSVEWSKIPDRYLDAEVTALHRFGERQNSTAQGCELHATIVPVQMELEIEG